MTIINPAKPIVSPANVEKLFLQYDKIVFLAPNEIHELLIMLNDFDIEAVAIDYDPKFLKSPHYINRDFVFDRDPEILNAVMGADLIVHKNIEKTYPVEMPKGIDVILIGDNDNHNGDCTPIESTEDIIKLYNVSKVYEKGCDDKETHFYVYGQI
jgi:hypothetical protein